MIRVDELRGMSVKPLVIVENTFRLVSGDRRDGTDVDKRGKDR
jgi:hypothetical protein